MGFQQRFRKNHAHSAAAFKTPRTDSQPSLAPEADGQESCWRKLVRVLCCGKGPKLQGEGEAVVPRQAEPYSTGQASTGLGAAYVMANKIASSQSVSSATSGTSTTVVCSDSNLALVASNDAVQDSKAAHPASPEALHQETEAATVPVATASIKLTPLFPLFNPTAAISVPMPAPVITNAIPASTPSAHSDLASSDMTHTKHTALVLYTAPLTNLMYTPRLEGSTHGTAPVSMVSRDTSLALVPYFGPSLVAAEVAAGYQMAAIRAYAFLSDSTSAHTLLAGMAGGHSNSPIFNRVLAHSTNWNGRRDLLPAVASSLALHSSYSGFAALTSYSSAALHVLASLAERFKMTAPAACINHSGSIAAFSRVGIVCDSASPITLKAVPRLGSSPVAMQLLAAFGQPRSLTAAASNTVKLQFSTIASPVAVPTLLNDSMLRLSPQLRKPFPLNGSFSHIEYLAKVACHLVQPSPSRAPLLPVPNVPRLELLTFVPGCVCGQPSSGKAVVDITYSSTDTHAAVVAFTVGSPASDKALTECPAEEATELGRRLELPQLQQQAFECMSKEVPTELHQVCWANWKVADLRCGEDVKQDGVQTFMSVSPGATHKDMKKAAVLRMAQAGTQEKMDAATALVAKEALMLHHCADNRRIVPLLFIGLRPPPMPHMPVNPCLVEYFGMPVADLSLDKLFGQSVWGTSSLSAPAGPSIAYREVAGYAMDTLRSLSHVHRRGVLHKALLPKHILLFSRGGSRHRLYKESLQTFFRVKLTGFQDAELLDRQHAHGINMPYRCAPAYIPPEASGTQPLTPAADVYQFGRIMQFMLTGDVCDLPVWVPTDWTHLVECCLARDPADRPTLAQALATLTLIKNSPPTYAPYGCSSAAISSTTVDQLYIDSTRDRSTGKVRADDSQSNVDLIPARVQGSGRSFSWDETDSDSPSAGEQDLRSSATLRLTKSDSFPFSGQLKGMADYGSVTEIQPVGSGALDLIPTEPAMLAAARSVAGHRALSFTQEELTPLLPSTAEPVPWPQYDADAWLSKSSTAQLHKGATPGTRRSADYEHRTAGTQQHSANGWLGNASIMQMSVGATPGSRRAAAHQLSTPGTPALLWCTDSNSTLIDCGHIPATDKGHFTTHTISGAAKGRPERHMSLNRWNPRAVRAAVQHWLPVAAQDTLKSIAESPRVQDAQDFCTDVWEHLSRRQTSPV